MIKKLLIIAILFISVFVHLNIPTATYAQIGTTEESSLDFSPYEPPSNDTFDALNPLKRGTQADTLGTPSGIIARALSFLFPLAGFILFIMIVWGGFEMLSQAATKKSMDAGRQRVTAAIIGFVLLFASYWIMQIVEVVFDVVIL